MTARMNPTLPTPMTTKAVVERTVSPTASSVITGVTSSGVTAPRMKKPTVSSGDKPSPCAITNCEKGNRYVTQENQADRPDANLVELLNREC